MISERHVARQDWRRRALYFAALANGVPAFSRTSLLDAASPDGTAIARVLYETPVAILTFSQLLLTFSQLTRAPRATP
jgi:hypothetical protein